MKIISVTDVLSAQGVAPPTLNALMPDANNYTVSLLQPKGVIDATCDGIRNRDREAAQAQFGRFLDVAFTLQPDLVVTPEYSMPWATLKQALVENKRPSQGKLWVLGCESIKYSELQQFKHELSAEAKVIFEDLGIDDSRFVDPLVYLFLAPLTDNTTDFELTLLVQFKTHPMVDPHDFERNLLQVGHQIYQFGNLGEDIRLITFICSDLLAVDDTLAREIYRDTLILHIQLNGKRQHPSLLDFRNRFLRLSGEWTELISLNWARETRVYVDDIDARVGKCAGSAWYLKANEIDLEDTAIASNHRKGFYYTRLESYRAHAVFLNFNQASFHFNASKVVRIGLPGPSGQRRGPHLKAIDTWDTEQTKWIRRDTLDDGFLSNYSECGGATQQIKAMYESCPVACERLISLCAGSKISKID